MNYQETLDYLYSFLDSEARLPRRPAEFNLPRTHALLAAAGNPQLAMPTIVVAGTKGKGSTSVMIEGVLRAAGYRTGLWTSPHLHSYRERIQVNRQLIGQDELVQHVAALRPVIDTFDQEAYGRPSVFDLGFMLALEWFRLQRVDIAVIEVGLGGRYDSANALTPLVSVITPISFDHMKVLGNTLGEIAYQKAGIAKPGVPLLSAPQHAEAAQVIAQVAAEVDAPLFALEAGAELDIHGQRFAGHLRPGLAGAFQRENARVAAAAALLLRAQGWPIGDDAIELGIAGARWPARFEVLPGQPAWVIDGAHNGDSSRRLLESLDEQFPGRRVVLLFGTTQDKDIRSMFEVLLPAASALVLTHSRHPRAETDLDGLAALAPNWLPVDAPIQRSDDVEAAVALARGLARPDDVVVVAGSLFVAAAAREILGLAHERD